MQETIGKIGFFDSGLGGLTILKEAVRRLPDYSYLYLGDNLNAPYGDKTEQEIYAHTLAGVEWLFAQGAELVVLACNTASAVALRRVQQEVLPAKYPEKKVLGIIIPTSQEAEQYSLTKHIGVLATEATVRSGVFEKELYKENESVLVTSQAGGRLVELIEADASRLEIVAEIEQSITQLLSRDEKIDALILGCTHYALIAELIQAQLPPQVRVVNEAPLVVKKMKEYLGCHREIVDKLCRHFQVELYTTNQDEITVRLMQRVYGEVIEIKSV